MNTLLFSLSVIAKQWITAENQGILLEEKFWLLFLYQEIPMNI